MKNLLIPFFVIIVAGLVRIILKKSAKRIRQKPKINSWMAMSREEREKYEKDENESKRKRKLSLIKQIRSEYQKISTSK